LEIWNVCWKTKKYFHNKKKIDNIEKEIPREKMKKVSEELRETFNNMLKDY